MRRVVIAACTIGMAVGCALKLPEIPQSHPANTSAPTGQTYATPAVLEVQPLTRPPDKPATRPAQHMEHDHTSMMDATRSAPAPMDSHQAHQDTDAKSQKAMQREGQPHE